MKTDTIHIKHRNNNKTTDLILCVIWKENIIIRLWWVVLSLALATTMALELILEANTLMTYFIVTTVELCHIPNEYLDNNRRLVTLAYNAKGPSLILMQFRFMLKIEVLCALPCL